MTKDAIKPTDWAAVAAKAQAFQAMHLAGLSDKSVIDRARFLMRFGVTRADAASMLGSSDDSLRILFGRETKKGKASDGKPGAKGA